MQLDLMNGNKRVDRVACYAGGKAAQSEGFIHPSKDWAGSKRPVHEGVFTIGKVHRGDFGPAFGGIWIPIEIIPSFKSNNRGAFGLHLDGNVKTARGSAGCIVFYNEESIERVIRWLGFESPPIELVVDWGTGFLKERGFSFGEKTKKPERMKIKIDKFVKSPNFSSRRNTIVDTIVLHNTEGQFNGAVSWLTNPASKVSAHYVVSRKGQIYQLVDLKDKAWHARSANSRSVGIEIEAYAGAEGLTPNQEQRLIALIKHVQWAVPTITKIEPHRKYSNTSCPVRIWPNDQVFYDWVKRNV